MIRRVFSHVSGSGLRAQLIRSGLGSGAVQGANRVLALALGIVLARMLGPDGYGVYAVAFAVMNLLMVVAEAGVPTLLMREVAASGGRSQWGLLRGALRRGTQFVALAATTVSVAGFLVLWWCREGLRPEVVYTTALMLMVLPVSALCKTVAHAMSGLHRVVIGQAVDMLIRPLTVLVIVAVVFVAWPHQREPHAAMAAQFLGAFTVLMVGLLVLRRFLPEESRDAVPEYRSREWLKSALPFTLIGGAGILNNQADIIMLGWLMTSEDVGVYRVAVQGATLVLFGFQAINAVVSPQFARFYAQGDMVQLQRTVTLSTRVILVITLPLVLFFIAGSQYIINFLFGESYLASYYPLSVLILGQFSVATIGLTGPLVSMAGYEHLVAKAMWVSAVSNVILNSIMIPYWGLIGAAIATSVTLTVWHIFLFWISLSEMGIWCLPVFVRKANKNESM